VLGLRLVRGTRPAGVARRLLLAAASAGAGFLLLCPLGYALAHPHRTTAATTQFLWCLVPVVAVVHLSAAVSRAEPGAGLVAGIRATGWNPARRLAGFAATATALWTALGSIAALAAFLYLRGDVTHSPLGAARRHTLGAGHSLPVAAVLTLLALVPLLGAAASALALLRTPGLRPATGRFRSGRAGRTRQEDEDGAWTAGDAAWAAGDGERDMHPGLPWGIALCLAGLMAELYADRWEHALPAGGIALPGGAAVVSPAMIGGWALTATGFVLAGPGLVQLAGRLLSSTGPGALRLLAGRGLQAEAVRLGLPLGVLCAAGFAGLGALRLRQTAFRLVPDPLTVFGIALVAVCTAASVLAAAAQSRAARQATAETLSRLGASRTILLRAAGLRVVALAAVLGPVTWLLAELAALPMYT
jgi:hypothetical protein